MPETFIVLRSQTGSQKSSGQGQSSHHSPKKYTITDKHGMKHDAYNVHIAVERAGTFPLYLGDEAVSAGH